MNDKELEEELKANVNKVMEEENKVMNINNEFDNINFEEIEKYLRKEETIIASYKSYNETINDGVTDQEFLTKSQRDNEIEVQRVEQLLKKVTDIIEEKNEEYEFVISNFEITEDDFKEMELYNKNVTALSDFYDKTGFSYKEYNTINIEEIKEDIIKFNEFSANLNNITYDNIGENIDIINNFADKYPNNKNVVDSLYVVFDSGNKILEDKENELLNMQKDINITRNEARIFDNALDDNDFVVKMMEQDEEVISQRENLSVIEQEIANLNGILETLEPESNGYKEKQKELEQKNNEYSNINDKISIKEKEYLNRKLELNNFDKEHGKKIEEFNILKQKIEPLRKKYLTLARNINNINQNVYDNNEKVESQEISENKTEKESDNKENENKTEKESDSKENENKTEKDLDNKEDENTKKATKNSNNRNNQVTRSNNNQTQEIDDNNQNRLNDSLTPSSAKNVVNNFLKMNDEEQRKFLQDNGYSKLNEAIGSIKGNKDGIKLSKKERNKINDIIDSEIANSLKEEDVKLKDGDIIALMNKLTEDYSDINNQELYKKLFLYNEKGLPFIANDMILPEDKKSLAFMVTEYMKNLKDGQLKESEIKDFEKYILNPLNASIIKGDLDDMNLSTRIRNKFSKNVPSYRILKSAMNDLNEIKHQIKSGKNLVGNIDSYVYSPDELANVIEEMETDRLARNSKNVPSKDEEPSI